LEQFTEAIKTQVKEDMSKQDHRLFGEILIDLGFMKSSQVNEVLDELLKAAYRFECPKCGIMISNCPSCGTEFKRA